MKRKHVIMIICIALAVLLVASFSFAWFADTMRNNAQIETYIHKSYFESGDGESAKQFQIYDPDTGAPLDPLTGQPLSSSASQDKCAFEIKYPVQLYYFAWLQALGYFNIPDDSGDSIEPVYFYLSADLDMTGWILPQIGTQTYPFVGNFDGNGHTITNLTVQNIEGSDPNQWTDKPADITGLNIVGFFGVVGSLENDDTVNGAVAESSGFTATQGYTYDNSVNEIKNFTLVDATIKTDLPESLAGIAAGYVNGTMENVKVVGGTLHSTATTALTYTVNISDFGAVGFCTEPYKDSNTVTTLIVYDPQVYSNAGGYAEDQGNNWGNSINMQTMYQDLLNVYQNYSATIPTNPAGRNIITVTKQDDVVTGYSVVGSGEPLSTVYAGNRRYNLKIVEKKDGAETVAFYSLVERSASFMYLYGGTTYVTQTIQEGSYYIHTGESTPAHYLTLNSQLAIADSASQSSDAKWIIKDGKIYTVRTKRVYDQDVDNGYFDEDYLYYLIKNSSHQLEIVELSQVESLPASVTGSIWTVEEDKITTGGYALVFKNGSWQLEQAAMYITDNAEQNYLSLNNTPAIVNQTSSANATSWSKETSGTGFKLAAMVNSTKYYLNCSSGGTLSVGSDSSTATVWYEDSSVANRNKIYMLTSPSDGWALFFNGIDWIATGYSINSAGNDWGGSIDLKTINARLKSAYGSSTATSTQYNLTSNDMTLAMTRSSTADPNTSSVIYRYRSGTAIPISMSDDYSALSSNTGYIVGSSIGTAANGSPKSSSYYIDYICNSLSGTAVNYTRVFNGTQAKYNSSALEVLTYYSGAWHRITDNYNSAHSSVNSALSSYSAMSVQQLGFEMYDSARDSLDRIFKKENGASENLIHGIHFDTNVPSSTSTISKTVSILGVTYQNYPLINSSMDFKIKSAGKITFFAGTYYNITSAIYANNFDQGKAYGGYSSSDYFNDSFFSLSVVERNSSTHAITSLRTISKIYKDTSLPSGADNPYVYAYKGETDSYSSNSRYSLVFDMTIMNSRAPVNLALYYFEIPVNPGEYAMGAVSSSQSRGAYMIYLDISANASIEGDSKIVDSLNVVTKHTDAGTLQYSDIDPVETNSPTYFPLAWSRYSDSTGSHKYQGDLPADTNTGYVISGSNTNSTIPGDIRVSEYDKNAPGNWASIRASLTNAGILDDTMVYTILPDGTQKNIAEYGIGIMHTMQYGTVSKTVNGLLEGNQHVYGLHFMNAQISMANTVVVPKAVINGVTKTNYVMPQDCIDFKVATKGRIAFMAGTYYSGSNGVQSFFSLHRIFRDSNDNITAIKQLSEIYSNGNASDGYIYRYKNESDYYDKNGNSQGSSVPEGYVKVYDLSAIDHPLTFTGSQTLTQNSVYYFEIPVDAGEYALGSSDTDGAYLIYLDIAANASFAVQTCTTEVTEQLEYTMNYPKGIAFVDDKDSTSYDDNSGKADPSKSVFVSIPMRDEGDNVISSGDTVFDIDQYANMEVTNTTSAIENGAIPQSIPLGGTLSVNGTALTMDASKRIIIEKVTAVTVDLAGATTTTVTTTTYTLENGVTTVVVEKTETTEFNGTSTTSTANTVTTVQREVDGVLVTEQTVGSNTTTPTQPLFDGDTLIPDDLTTDPIVKAEAIFKYSYSGNGLTNIVERDGDLNAVLTDMVITIDGDDYTVYDVEEGTGVKAGKYDVTISGTAGTYTVTVEVFDDEFVFTINNTVVASTGNLSVAVAAAPTP